MKAEHLKKAMRTSSSRRKPLTHGAAETRRRTTDARRALDVDFDFFELSGQCTIARSPGISKYYNTNAIGKFGRLKPISVRHA